MSEYTAQAESFLTKHNLTFRVVLIGDDCPRFCKDAAKQNDMDKVNVFPRKTHIHGKHYRCTVSASGRGHVTYDFWNSYADEEWNALGTRQYRNGETLISKYGREKITQADGTVKWVNGSKHMPTAYDLFACIEKSEPGSFDDFCSNFGYDTDSRNAEETWRAVVDEYRKTARFFSVEELTELQEIN